MAGLMNGQRVPLSGRLHSLCRYKTGIAPDPKRTAFHEAGHAIVAQYLGLPVKSVVIQTNHDGKTWFHDRACDHKELGMTRLRWIRCHAASLVAGDVCEEMAMGNNEPGEEKWTAVGMMQNVRPEPGEETLTPEEAMTQVEKLENEVRAILEANWSLVQEFAAELEQCKLLEDGPLAELLSRVDVCDR